MNRKEFVFSLAAFSLFGACSAATKEGKIDMKGKKVLVACYSWSGNTASIADSIAKKLGAKRFDVVCKTPYTKNYRACCDQAKKELNEGFLPELESDIDLAEYDVIFLGSPNWWGTACPPVRSFIAKHDFTGKIVVPFFTHGGGGMQNCEKDMVKLVTAKGAKTLPAKTAYGTFASVLPSAYMGWLKDIGFNDL